MRKKCLVCCAIGERYVMQTRRMAGSFIAYNPDWDIVEFYDHALVSLLPDVCRNWTAFDRVEIGRWYALKKALETYDTALYCDGDIWWYDRYEESQHTLVLYPHCITRHAQEKRKHYLWKDGNANIGILEMSRTEETERLFDFITGEVLYKPSDYVRHGTLWLQPLVSFTTNLYDVVYNTHAGYDVAFWNLATEDREVIMWEGKRMVGTHDDELFPLVSFHFSSKSIEKLDRFGVVVQELKAEYLKQ